jgi:LysM repeat protein
MRTMAVAMMTAALAMAALALGGCGDDRGGMGGMIITEDGRMLADTADNNRGEAVYTIDRQLTAKLGPHWCARAAIAELPQWADDREESGEWRWETATVQVDLTGDGQAPLPVPADEVKQGVFDYLRVRVHHATTGLAITVTQTVSAERFAALAAAGIHGPGASTQQQNAPPAPAVAQVGGATGTAAAPAGPRTYIVQTGDTLAEISAVFYGDTAQWRRIVDANPGLDPGRLVPGTKLVIP